jgi:zinc finger SWIM domain-containing protein 3
MSGSLLNSTNNRLESINGKLKQVINRHSSLEDFISRFFVILSTLRSERDHKAAVNFQKVKVQNFGIGSPEYQYSQLLTSYASSYVSRQLNLVHKVKEITASEDGTLYTVETSGGVKNVSLHDCDCLFSKSMLLPCRHIFALRRKLGTPLFDESLCNIRWTSKYYRENQRMFLDVSWSSSDSVQVTQATSKPSRVLSQHQKYRKAIVLTSDLASILSEASGIHYDRRTALLKELIVYWKNGEEVALTEIDDGKSYPLKLGCGFAKPYMHSPQAGLIYF